MDDSDEGESRRELIGVDEINGEKVMRDVEDDMSVDEDEFDWVSEAIDEKANDCKIIVM